MATDDKQILVTGTAPAPADWKVPGNGQVRPKVVYASYDGSGAAGDFFPALKLISDGGEVVGIFQCDTSVAAGGSADVSWFPGGGLGGAATGVTQLSWAQMVANVNPFASSGFNASDVSFNAGSLFTNDTSTFSGVSSGGTGYLGLSAVGVYLVYAGISMNIASAPAVGALVQTYIAGSLGQNLFQPDFESSWQKDGASSWTADTTVAGLVSVASSTPSANRYVGTGAGQNSGVNADLDAYVGAVYLGPTGV